MWEDAPCLKEHSISGHHSHRREATERATQLNSKMDIGAKGFCFDLKRPLLVYSVPMCFGILITESCSSTSEDYIEKDNGQKL